MANKWGNNGNSERHYFGGGSKSLQMVTEAMKLKDALGRKGMTNLDSILKSRDITNKGLSSQTYGFFSNYV